MNAASRALLAAVALGALLAAFCVCVGALVVGREAAPALPSAASPPGATPPPAFSHLPRAAGEERAHVVIVTIVNLIVAPRPAAPRLPIVICGTGRC